MVYFRLFALMAGMMFLFSPAGSFASVTKAPPPDNIAYTSLNSVGADNLLTTSLDLPARVSAGVKVAGVYWLPDYLKENQGRNSDCVGGNCNGDAAYDCPAYGYETPGSRDMRLYTCKETYPAGNEGGKCFYNCRCKDNFIHTTANCRDSEGKTVAGLGCEGKYERCECQTSVTPGIGEECALRCTFNNSCVRTRCKSGVSVGVGEECKERCASNRSVCTKKGCKPAVRMTYPNDYCIERCASDSSICTAKRCNPSCSSDSSFPYGYYTVSNGCGGSCKKASACTECWCNSAYCPPPPPPPTPPVTHTHSYSCPSGYSATNSWGSAAQTTAKTCSCGNKSGTCYKAPAGGQTGGDTNTCNYTVTAASCAAQCKNAGSQSCSKNGTIYYSGCGASKCSQGQTCENGSCKTPAPACNYTTTASSCASQCRYNGSQSCTKNGTTYYNGCGSSTCSQGQTCENGRCVSSAPDTCQVPGSFGGTSCSNFIKIDCAVEYMRRGKECTDRGITPALNIGACDVDSWRGCCQYCQGGSLY